MGPDLTEFANTFSRFLETVTRQADTSGLTEIGSVVADFLGVPLNDVDPLVETVPQHQVVDIDAALDQIRTEHDGRLIGASGGAQRSGLESFAEFLERSHWNFRPGAVAYVRMPTGPDQ